MGMTNLDFINFVNHFLVTVSENFLNKMSNGN